MAEKKYFQITTSFGREFEGMFEEIKKLRPDLKDNSKIAQEGVRELWKKLKEDDKVEKVEKKS